MGKPTTLGKYTIEGQLGKGAMGVVYLARDPGIGRQVAIKTVLASFEEHDEALERFRREARAAGNLSHPNVVTVHDFGEEEGSPFIVMELVEGRELHDVLKSERRLPVQRTIEIIGQILKALDYCHANGLVHRDLKPANIFVLSDGVVKVADFGIARTEDSDLTRSGTALGTPSYMSPEQVLGERVDGRSDLFAVGAMLYEMLTGKRPFPGPTVPTIVSNIANLEPEAPSQVTPELPAALDAVVSKALAKRPEDRFQSAEEFANALELAADAGGDAQATHAFHEAETVAADAAMLQGQPPAGGPQPARRRFRLVAVSLAVALLAVGAVWWGMTGEPPVQPTGFVSLNSDPAGARVLRSGDVLGETPVRVELDIGVHELVLEKTGHQPLTLSVEVESGAELDVDLPLQPN